MGGSTVTARRGIHRSARHGSLQLHLRPGGAYACVRRPCPDTALAAMPNARVMVTHTHMYCPSFVV
mgnify:CR=1 FL=1